MSSSNAATVKKMKKVATSSAATVSTTTTTTPIATTSVTSPVATTNTKVGKSSKADSTPTPAANTTKSAKVETSVPVVSSTTTVDNSSATSELSLSDEIKNLRDQLTTIRETASAALNSLKRVEKRSAAEVKEARKSKRQPRVDDNGERILSNFERPVPISDELSALLGGPKNNVMAHKDVTREIHKYLNTNNLRNGHIIKPNEPLRKLLKLGENEETDIFRLQRLLKHHYPKSLRPVKDAKSA